MSAPRALVVCPTVGPGGPGRQSISRCPQLWIVHVYERISTAQPPQGCLVTVTTRCLVTGWPLCVLTSACPQRTFSSGMYPAALPRAISYRTARYPYTDRVVPSRE